MITEWYVKGADAGCDNWSGAGWIVPTQAGRGAFYQHCEKENFMNKNYGSVIGRAAAGAIAVETIVFAISLIWEVIIPSEFARNLGYIASLLIAPSVVTMMACFYEGTRVKVLGLLALVSSVIYAPFCISTYFLQLSVVAFNPLNWSSPQIVDTKKRQYNLSREDSYGEKTQNVHSRVQAVSHPVG